MDTIIKYRWLCSGIALILLLNFSICCVDGQSMEPTLKNHQYVLSCRWCTIQKGDIIIFNNPNNELSVKRVVASEDDQVEISNNHLAINGVRSSIPVFAFIDDNQGDYFVVGDNNLNSFDSRDYGWISREQIKGKVILK